MRVFMFIFVLITAIMLTFSLDEIACPINTTINLPDIIYIAPGSCDEIEFTVTYAEQKPFVVGCKKTLYSDIPKSWKVEIIPTFPNKFLLRYCAPTYDIAEVELCAFVNYTPSKCCGYKKIRISSYPPTEEYQRKTEEQIVITPRERSPPFVTVTETEQRFFAKAGEEKIYGDLYTLDYQIKIRFANSVKTGYVKSFEGQPTVNFSYGIPYKWIKVSREGFTDEDLDYVVIEFRVSKEWMEKNKVSRVEIYRFDGENWQLLRSAKYYEDLSYSYYYAYSPTLSLFVISGTSEKILPFKFLVPLVSIAAVCIIVVLIKFAKIKIPLKFPIKRT